MKRKGHVYERVVTWENVKNAQIESSKNKPNSYGVRKHKKHWLRDLIDLHNLAIEGKVRTSEYRHDLVVSGQDKLRDIAKLDYYPDNIWHQMLILATEEELDKTFIEHAYANRKGKGQVKALKKIHEWMREDPKGTMWCALGDIVKYYPNMPHSLIRSELEHSFKDEQYIEAMLEPVYAYTDEDKSTPIGTRPSQLYGNLCLRKFHRFAKEEVKVKYFLMYLDNFWNFGRTKGEVKRYYKREEKFLNSMGLKCHAPVFIKVEKGVDGLGFVTKSNGNSSWRRKNKAKWLRRRSKVTNPRRIREIDAAAWGALKHGNKQCKRLFKMITMADLGLQEPVPTDKNGNRIIEWPGIPMKVILDKEVLVHDFVSGVVTTHGSGRMAMDIEWMEQHNKLITNSAPIKKKVEMLGEKNITLYKAKFICKGGNNYDMLVLDIKEINHRAVAKKDGKLFYVDTQEEVTL